MDASTSLATHHDQQQHDAEHEHHELGWWRKYIFSTDHKVIGIQYLLCGLVFLFFGFSLMMLRNVINFEKLLVVRTALLICIAL